MPFGPFVRRELLTSARRRWTYGGRSVCASLALAWAGALVFAWDRSGFDRDTLSGMRSLALATFGVMMALPALSLLGVLGDVGGAIPGERDRRTLDALLSTRLSSAEIVLGVVVSGLVRSFAGLAVMLPVLALMVPLWGFDPNLIAATLAGLVSTTFALAALAVVSSVGSPTARKGVSVAALVASAWFMTPFMSVMLLPRVWPRLARGLSPLTMLLYDTSPWAVFLNAVGFAPRGPLGEALSRMIALQLAGGVLLTLAAVVRLRPACRAAYDGEGRASRRLSLLRVRRKDWPPCGDDPIFWRERYGNRGTGRWERLIGAACNLGVAVALTVWTYWVAQPAFVELFARGYVAHPGALSEAVVNPLVLIFLRGADGVVPPGLARVEFNAFLRVLTPLLQMLVSLVAVGFATEALTTERQRDTWSGLLATPLTGPEILRGWGLGVVWRLRAYLAVIVGLWTLGLLAGALHPLGFLAVTAGLFTSLWSLIALGLFTTLRKGSRAREWGVFPALLLMLVPMALPFVPEGRLSVGLGVASPPFLNYLALVSLEDVNTAGRTGAFPPIERAGLRTGEGVRAVVATLLAGVLCQGAAAFWLTRAVCREFDEAVGRPTRPVSGPPSS